GSPAWQPPDESELREHFADDFLRLLPPDIMVRALRPVATQLHQDLEVTSASPQTVRARIGALRVEAAASPSDPERRPAMRIYPIARPPADGSPGEPPHTFSGPVPAAARRVLDESYAELGLTALSAAARWPGERASGWPLSSAPVGADDVPWSAAMGWADT